MAESAKSKAKQKQRIWVALTVPVILIVFGIFYFIQASRFAGTDNAYIKADKVSISSQVAGEIVEAAVGENQQVLKGQLLFKIDDAPYRIALARAQANLNKVVIELSALKSRYRQKQEELKGARIDAAYFEGEYKRQADLAASKVASVARVDQTRHDADASRQEAAKLEQELQELVAELDGNPDLSLEDFPAYREASAGLARAELDLAHTVVRAPTNAIVTKSGNLQVGNYAFSGAPMLSLVKTDHFWVEANMKETDLAHVRVGQPATAEIDMYGGDERAMKVTSVAPATGAEFAILPPQNATGNWVKVVQRIPVRLEFEDAQDASRLRAGMSVTISIDTGEYHALPKFLRKLFGTGTE